MSNPIQGPRADGNPAHIIAAQADAARALIYLLDHAARLRLAPVNWTLHADSANELMGALAPGSREELAAWGQALGAEVDWQRFDGEYPEVRSRIGETRVLVWTSLGEATL